MKPLFFDSATMPIDSTQLAVIIVTLCAIVFVATSVTLLIKIFRRTEIVHVEIKGLLNELKIDIRGFKLASKNLNLLIERSSGALVDLELRLARVFKEFSRDLKASPLSPELIEFTQEGMKVLQTVAEAPAESLAKWQSENRVELNRLLSQKNSMEAELNLLREKYVQSERQVVDLRRKSYSAEEAESAAEQLSLLNERLVSDAREARRLQLEAEEKLEPLTNELHHVKARLEIQARPLQSMEDNAELMAGNTVLRERVAGLESTVKRLQKDLQVGEEELSRTMREKAFIEERFIQDDNVVLAG